MKCPQYGHDNPEGSQFCGGCGANLNSGEASVGTEAPMVGYGGASVGTELPMVGFGEAVSRGFRKSSTFSGRATRAEFWWWQLFVFVTLIGVASIDAFVSSGILFPFFWFGSILMNVTVTVRRLHDNNMTGWWYLIIFIPFVGLGLFVICVQAGDKGPNKYGPNPRQATSQ